MAFLPGSYNKIKKELAPYNATLVAVTKTKPVEEIMEAYNAGQRDFGENYVQELVDKYETLPKDIRWHFIGHLQSNKVKYISSFIHLIQGVDSEKLLIEINKEGRKINRLIPCLLQINISSEGTKFGMDETELKLLVANISSGKTSIENTQICGLMGMASFTEDNDLIKKEFNYLKSLYDDPQYSLPRIQSCLPSGGYSILSIGMSADYRLALGAGSNMVRIGSLLFGSRI